MNAHLLRKAVQTVSRHRASLLATARFAVPLAYGGGLWLQLIHELEGAHERYELPPVWHWLRDSTLALPLMFVAVYAALFIARQLLTRSDQGSAPRLSRATTAATVALVSSATLAVGSPIHGLLFEAEHHQHGLVMSWYQHMAYDAILALAAHLLIASVVVLLPVVWVRVGELRLRWTSVRRQLRRRPLARLAIQAVTALVLLAPQVPALQLAVVPIAAAATGDDATMACLTNGTLPAGTALKHFDIEAHDIDIPLNRFGDHEPNGKMYVLKSQWGAVQAQLQRPYQDRVSIGLNGFPLAGSTGKFTSMQEDAIQSLVIRANGGDCVEIAFTNLASPAKNDSGGNVGDGKFGIHIDGLAFNTSGDAVGNNAQTAVANGTSATYRYFIPNDPALEGAHYLHPGPSNRAAVEHGLFGSFVVEPPHAQYYRPDNSATPVSQANPQTDSGWSRTIQPGPDASASGWCNGFGCPAFRENVKVMHDIGDENYKISTRTGSVLPTRDPHTDSYRPGSRGFNYRSEPFMDRLDFNPDQKSQTYGSYTFGDPATIVPRGYVGDPTKFRIMHAGSEVFHVYHLHGGAIRWRFNPRADQTWDYGKTGLNKHPQVERSESWQLDAQSIGPGESYNLEIEGGAGSNQGTAGEFLFHCHIAHHYFSGMWGFWRVFDTAQLDLAPLPDRTGLQAAIDSSKLIGKTFNGMTINTATDLDAWIRPQLPPQGQKKLTTNSLGNGSFSQDGSVMDWQVDANTGIYVGEKEDTSNWVDMPRIPSQGAHTGSLIVDRFLTNQPNRPVLLFNPVNGRPAFPLLRTHAGSRPPFAPNGHSGAPYLGEKAKAVTPGTIDPYAGRNDTICPTGVADPRAGDVTSPDKPQIRYNNIVALPVPIPHTAKAAAALAAGQTDPNLDMKGAIFVLAQNKAANLDPANATKREPIALRANIGDCVFNTLVSEEKDGDNELPYAKTNIHIHHVQFDTQASDGVISGFSFEQSVRPYQLEDTQLTVAAATGDTTLRVANVDKFLNADGSIRPIWMAIGQGTNVLEVRKITNAVVTDAVSRAGTVTLATALNNVHAAGDWAGVEFVQYIWYPDIALDNIFFHDHVNGIYGWSHGMVGQFVVEPRGATYHDPKTGVQIASGTQADIHCVAANGCTTGLMPGYVDGSYREQVLWTIDNHGTIGAPMPAENSLNLHSEPWADRLARNGDPSLMFSSWTHGDPYTPQPRAYQGDQLVVRTVNVSQNVNVLAIDGARFSTEMRYSDQSGADGHGAYGPNVASKVNAIHYGISERYTLVLDDGSGNRGLNKPGDYLYHDGEGKAFRNGAWGMIRVLGGNVADLQPLPGNTLSTATTVPSATGGRPPAASDPGSPCPSTAVPHTFAISAVNVPGALQGATKAFVATTDAAVVQAGTKKPEPLVLHVAEGECVKVTLTNDARSGLARVSFHLPKLASTPNSAGINIGFGPEQSVASGLSQSYVSYADSWKLGTTAISGFGGNLVAADATTGVIDPLAADAGRQGLYGALVVSPAGATFTDPVSGAKKDMGTQVDVHYLDSKNGTAVPSGYRDFTLALAEQDPIIGTSLMTGGYPNDALRTGTLVNYQNAAARTDDSNMFSSKVYGDPATPTLQAYAGDAMRVHVIVTPGSEQVHTVSLGHSFLQDQTMGRGVKLQTRAVGPFESLDAIIDHMGGPASQVGDFIYQDRRLPFTQAGMWGLLRSVNPAGTSCVVRPLDGTSIGACTASTVTMQACAVNVPALQAGWGYYSIINTAASGPIKVTWTLPNSQSGTLAIQSGNPYAGLPDPANTGVKSGTLAQDSGKKSLFTATTSSMGAGQYTAYFFAGDQGLASTSTNGQATYITASCP